MIENVQVPWSIVWDPDGDMLFTERPGRIRVFEGGKLREQPLHSFTDVLVRSESGLMGLCLHPNYKQNRWLYTSYAYRSGGDEYVKVVRFKNEGSRLSEEKVIVDLIPSAPNHAGNRLKFGPDGKLYITCGDATDRQLAQKMDTLAGKILRVNDDGSVPADNPFVNKQGIRPEIWAYGSRNAQGIDWQPGTNALFETEHGPSGFDGPGGGDEVNVITKGANLGWPLVSHEEKREGTVAPIRVYTPAVAPASAVFYTGDKLPQFKNHFFFGCLVGNALIRLELNGSRIVKEERMFRNLGRIRDVANGPDGYLYFSTSNRDGRGRPGSSDDRIVRLVPGK